MTEVFFCLTVDHGKSGYLDTVQYELKCCGLNSTSDWKMSIWYDRRARQVKAQHSVWLDSLPAATGSLVNMAARNVPMTCCRELNDQPGMSTADDFC